MYLPPTRIVEVGFYNTAYNLYTEGARLPGEDGGVILVLAPVDGVGASNDGAHLQAAMASQAPCCMPITALNRATAEFAKKVMKLSETEDQALRP